MMELFYADDIELKYDDDILNSPSSPPKKKSRLSLPNLPFENLRSTNLEVGYLLPIITLFRIFLSSHQNQIIEAAEDMVANSETDNLLFFLIQHGGLLGKIPCATIEKQFLTVLDARSKLDANRYLRFHFNGPLYKTTQHT
jgi:hypothetical protein